MTTHRTSKAALEIGEANIVSPFFCADGDHMTAMMIGAVHQDAGDTGLSQLANRYFLLALHRGWLLDGKHSSPARCQTRRRAPGRPHCARGANQFGWDDTTTDVGARLSHGSLQPLMFAGAVRLRSYDAVFPEGHKAVVADWLLLH